MRRYFSARAANAIDAGAPRTRGRNSSSRGFSGIRKTLSSRYGFTVMAFVVLLVRPALSVTDSKTLNVCAVVEPAGRVNVCTTVWPVPDPPSPNDHEKDVIVRPGAACVADASKVTC